MAGGQKQAGRKALRIEDFTVLNIHSGGGGGIVLKLQDGKIKKAVIKFYVRRITFFLLLNSLWVFFGNRSWASQYFSDLRIGFSRAQSMDHPNE